MRSRVGLRLLRASAAEFSAGRMRSSEVFRHTHFSFAFDPTRHQARFSAVLRSSRPGRFSRAAFRELSALGLQTSLIRRIATEVVKPSRLDASPSHRRACAVITAGRTELERASGEFVECNLRLVLSMAGRFKDRGLELEDLVQEGTLGLMHAVDGFDPARGFRFSTYATWWVRQLMLRALSNTSRTIRLPVHVDDHVKRVVRTTAVLRQRLGRRPSTAEVSGESGVSADKVTQSYSVSQRPISLQTPVGDDGKASVGDFIPDTGAESPLGVALHRDLARALNIALADLAPREQRILRLRFGLDGLGRRTLTDISKQFDVTRERIRQIEVKALERLRDHPGRLLAWNGAQ